MKAFRNSMVMLVVLIILVVAFFVVEGITGNGGDLMRTSIGTAKLVKEQTIEAEGCKEIIIKNSKNAFSVFLYKGNSNEIVLKEYMSFEPEESDYAKVENSGRKIEITGAKLTGFEGFRSISYKGYMEVYMPKDFSGSLMVSTVSGEIKLSEDISFTELDAASVSGKISFCDLDIEKSVAFSSVSGAISIGEVSAESFDASTTSGSINVEGLKAERIDAASVSGSINIRNAEGKFSLGTTSGKIALTDGTTLYGKANSVSGSIQIETDELAGDIKLSTTSGFVKLSIPEDARFSFDASSTSGNVSTFFNDKLSFNKRKTKAEGKVGADPEYEIEINTVSGSIKVTD